MSSNTSGNVHVDLSFPLQKAIYARLLEGGANSKTDPTRISDTKNVGVLVCDHFAKNTQYPYISVGDIDLGGNWNTKTDAGQELIAEVNVYSKYSGMLEISKIGGEVLFQLTRGRLDLSADGAKVIHHEFEAANNVRQDGETVRRIIRVVFKVQNLTTIQPH